MKSRRRRHQAKSEMNVVPYIDVMLVLLVIFMISAPLLSQSVAVDLPQSNNASKIAQHNNEETPWPLVISISRQGAYYIDRTDDNVLPVSKHLIRQITEQTLAENPSTPVYIRADKSVKYNAVMIIMDVLKSSGADKVGLVTADEGK